MESSIELTQRSQQELDSEQSKLVKEEDEEITPQKELDQKKEKIKKILVWIKIKLEALFWVALSLYLIWYSNFFGVLYSHKKINNLFFGIFMITVGINVTVGLYAAFILPFILGIDTPIDVYAPRVVYIGAISGFICFFSLIITIWPAFGFFSPLLIFTFFMGFLNISHFFPNNNLGSLLLSLVFVGSFFSHLIIDHGGMLHYGDGETESI